ncbi:MAG: hypothetical protein ACREME_10040, partial [Gemmatimonadales bacterium]
MGFPRSYVLWDRGPRSDAATAADLRHPGLRLGDLEALRDLPGVASVHGRNPAGQMVVTGPADQRLIWVDGVDAGYLEVRSYP